MNQQVNKHPLEKVKWGVIAITAYKGVLVERQIGGYLVLGQKCQTPEEVDRVIEDSCVSLKNSLIDE